MNYELRDIFSYARAINCLEKVLVKNVRAPAHDVTSRLLCDSHGLVVPGNSDPSEESKVQQ